MNPPSSALLICPSDRPTLAFLGRAKPFALVPVLGRSLLDLWLADLAARGIQSVLILAADRPELLRRAVGQGEPWGLKARVIPEARELTPAEALAKHGPASPEPPPLVAVADRLPGAAQPFASPAEWFASLRALMPDAAAARRVGVRAFAPGVWVHARARVSPSAHLEPPCWVGANVWIGPDARLGPGSIAEEDAYIDEGAEVTESFVGPATYVGAMTHLDHSLAWGRSLCKWTSGSVTEVHDDLLLGELGHSSRPAHRPAFFARALALAALVLLSPVILVALARRRRGTPLFLAREAVRAPVVEGSPLHTCRYLELQGVPGLWRRYPELWNIAKGEFHWIGNRPLSRDQAALLDSEFDRLWLSVPPGSLSLADAEQCQDLLGDEGRAHASFYAVRRGLRTNLDILRRTLAHPLR